MWGLTDLSYTFKSLKAAKEWADLNRVRGDYTYIVDSKTWKMICIGDLVELNGKKQLKWRDVEGECFNVGTPDEEAEKRKKKGKQK